MLTSHLPRRPQSAAGTAATPLNLLPSAALALLACAALALIGVPAPAFAQAAAADPLNATAKVPPTAYRSAFTSYRRLSETPVGSWRDANDTVTRIGGWRVYAREASQPEVPASASASGSGSTPAPTVTPRAKP
jgi:hypothetical protein